MIVTLAQAKAHLRVDFDDHDAVITALIDAAEDYLGRIGCPVDTDPIAPTVQQASLLLIGHWFDNGSTVDSGTSHEVPFSVSALVASVREVTP